ncbi:hypothetical protein [Actinomadura oligospora]|uniref:hypothetical protein n=1 Tax=Actinomadura oligospora TaxID=111804 RepID=UPI00047E27CD|nr:hypothetical protein [Actinomadura oligospora]
MPDLPPPTATGAHAAPDPLAVTRALLRHLGELARARSRRGPSGPTPPTPDTPAHASEGHTHPPEHPPGASAPKHASGPSAPEYGPGPSAPKHGSGPSAPEYGPGPSAPKHGSGPSAPEYGPGPSAPKHGSGPSAPEYGPGPSAPKHGSGPSAPEYGPGPSASKRGSGASASGHGSGVSALEYGSGASASERGSGASALEYGSGPSGPEYGSGASAPKRVSGGGASEYGSGAGASEYGSGERANASGAHAPGGRVSGPQAAASGGHAVGGSDHLGGYAAAAGRASGGHLVASGAGGHAAASGVHWLSELPAEVFVEAEAGPGQVLFSVPLIPLRPPSVPVEFDTWLEMRHWYRALRDLADQDLALVTGLLSWRPPDGPPVRGHLLSTPVEIVLDDRTERVDVIVSGPTTPLDHELLADVPGYQPGHAAWVWDAVQAGQGFALRASVSDVLRKWCTAAFATDDDPAFVYRDDWAPGGQPGEIPAVRLAPALVVRQRPRSTGLAAHYDLLISSLADPPPDGLVRFLAADLMVLHVPDPEPDAAARMLAGMTAQGRRVLVVRPDTDTGGIPPRPDLPEVPPLTDGEAAELLRLLTQRTLAPPADTAALPDPNRIRALVNVERAVPPEASGEVARRLRQFDPAVLTRLTGRVAQVDGILNELGLGGHPSRWPSADPAARAFADILARRNLPAWDRVFEMAVQADRAQRALRSLRGHRVLLPPDVSARDLADAAHELRAHLLTGGTLKRGPMRSAAQRKAEPLLASATVDGQPPTTLPLLEIALTHLTAEVTCQDLHYTWEAAGVPFRADLPLADRAARFAEAHARLARVRILSPVLNEVAELGIPLTHPLQWHGLTIGLAAAHLATEADRASAALTHLRDAIDPSLTDLRATLDARDPDAYARALHALADSQRIRTRRDALLGRLHTVHPDLTARMAADPSAFASLPRTWTTSWTAARRIDPDAVPLWDVPAAVPAAPDSLDAIILDGVHDAGPEALFLLWYTPRVILLGRPGEDLPPLDAPRPPLPQDLHESLSPTTPLYQALLSRALEPRKPPTNTHTRPDADNPSSSQPTHPASALPPTKAPPHPAPNKHLNPDVRAEPDARTEPSARIQSRVPAEPGAHTELSVRAEPGVRLEPGEPTEPGVIAEPDAPTEPSAPTEPRVPVEPNVRAEHGVRAESGARGEPDVRDGTAGPARDLASAEDTAYPRTSESDNGPTQGAEAADAEAPGRDQARDAEPNARTQGSGRAEVAPSEEEAARARPGGGPRPHEGTPHVADSARAVQATEAEDAQMQGHAPSGPIAHAGEDAEGFEPSDVSARSEASTAGSGRGARMEAGAASRVPGARETGPHAPRAGAEGGPRGPGGGAEAGPRGPGTGVEAGSLAAGRGAGAGPRGPGTGVEAGPRGPGEGVGAGPRVPGVVSSGGIARGGEGAVGGEPRAHYGREAEDGDSGRSTHEPGAARNGAPQSVDGDVRARAGGAAQGTAGAYPDVSAESVAGASDAAQAEGSSYATGGADGPSGAHSGVALEGLAGASGAAQAEALSHVTGGADGMAGASGEVDAASVAGVSDAVRAEMLSNAGDGGGGRAGARGGVGAEGSGSASGSALAKVADQGEGSGEGWVGARPAVFAPPGGPGAVQGDAREAVRSEGRGPAQAAPHAGSGGETEDSGQGEAAGPALGNARGRSESRLEEHVRGRMSARAEDAPQVQDASEDGGSGGVEGSARGDGSVQVQEPARVSGVAAGEGAGLSRGDVRGDGSVEGPESARAGDVGAGEGADLAGGDVRGDGSVQGLARASGVAVGGGADRAGGDVRGEGGGQGEGGSLPGRVASTPINTASPRRISGVASTPESAALPSRTSAARLVSGDGSAHVRGDVDQEGSARGASGGGQGDAGSGASHERHASGPRHARGEESERVEDSAHGQGPAEGHASAPRHARGDAGVHGEGTGPGSARGEGPGGRGAPGPRHARDEGPVDEGVHEAADARGEEGGSAGGQGPATGGGRADEVVPAVRIEPGRSIVSYAREDLRILVERLLRAAPGLSEDEVVARATRLLACPADETELVEVRIRYALHERG